MQVCQYGNLGQRYITGKKITLPKMKAKIFRTDTLKGVTCNLNLWLFIESTLLEGQAAPPPCWWCLLVVCVVVD
jgi:hypothetical protein